MSSMYHGGDEFLPVGYGGWVGDLVAGFIKYAVPVAPLIANEPPCILAYRTIPDITTLGISSWVRSNRETEYRELQKIEDKIQDLRNRWKAADVIGGGRAGINDQICALINKKQDLTRRLKAAKKSAEKTEARRETNRMERELATPASTYAPYDPMTGGIAPAGVAPAGAQTVSTTGGEQGGGISTTMLLAVGVGAVLLFALSRKSASASASPYKGF